jgi:integrase
VSREDPKLGWFADVVVALAFTGLRIGELRDLCWDDLDEELKNLTVPDYSKQGTKRERSNTRENKGKKSRTLPVEQSTFRLVLERLGKTPCKDGLIFHGPGGGRIKPDRVRLVLKNRVLPRVLERLGPKGRRNASKSSQAKSLKDLTPHGLRHFFVSVVACGGVAEMTVVRWLGHHDSKITRRYFHLRDAESHQQIEKVTFFKTLSEAGPEGGTLPSSPAA